MNVELVRRRAARLWVLAAAAWAPWVAAASAQEAAPEDEDHYVAVHVGKLIAGNGEEQDQVTILLNHGKVDAIGKTVELPYPCEEIDARDLVAMPGLIHAASRLGLLSYNRTGVKADLLVKDEFIPMEDEYEDARKAGFTTLVLTPPGTSGIPGQGLVIRTADLGAGLIVKDSSYVKLNLVRTGNEKTALKKAFDDAQKEIEKVKKAREEWEKKKKEFEAEQAKKKAEEEAKKKETEEKKDEKEGQAYRQEPPKPEEKKEPAKEEPKTFPEFKAPEIKKELRPLVDMIEKKEGVFGMAQIDGASTYLHLRDALKKHDVPYVLLNETQARGRFSVVDIFLAADELGERKETLLVNPTLSYYPYSINRINIPRDLVQAGVKVAFFPESDSKSSLEAVRYQVADVIHGGLAREEAVKAMTLHVAEAVGLGDRLGSIEKGKDGNLLLLSGDPFDVQTKVERVLIEGHVVYDRAEEAGR